MPIKMTPQLFYSESILGSADPSELKPCMKNLISFMSVMVLSGVNQGYTDYSNQAYALYNVHYNWTDSHDIIVH